MRAFIVCLLLPLFAAGCTYNVAVTPSTAVAQPLAGTPRIERPMTFEMTPELATLKANADQVYVCSAHAYPIDAGPAIARSVEAVNDAAFANLVPAGGERIIRLALEDFKARLTFDMGWWDGTANANTNLVIRATVTDAAGAVLLDTPLAASGTGRKTGQCSVGADALSTAFNQTLEAVIKDYVARVIKSGLL